MIRVESGLERAQGIFRFLEIELRSLTNWKLLSL